MMIEDDKNEGFVDDVSFIDILNESHRFFKDDRRTLEEDKSQRFVNDVSFTFDESHRLFEGRNEETTIGGRSASSG